MPLPAYPHDLENKTWQKKSVVADDTGIGAKLEELAAAYKHIDVAAFAWLESAHSLAELEQWTAATNDEVAKVHTTSKAIHEFSSFASRKSAELGKNKLFPKETLKLIEQMGHIALTFDVELVKSANDIRKSAATRLAALPTRATGYDPDTDDKMADAFTRLRTVHPDRPHHFVIALGKPIGLVVSRIPITAVHRQTAKAMRQGMGRLLEGTCHCEGGVFIFVFPDRPRAGLAANIVKIVLAHTGHKVRVKVRGPDAELDDETDSPDLLDTVDEAEPALAVGQTRPTQSDPRAAAFQTRLTDIQHALAEILKSSAITDQQRNDLFNRFKTARDQGNNGAHDEAFNVLERILHEAQHLKAQAAKGDVIQRARHLSDEVMHLVNVPPNLDVALKKRLADALHFLQTDNIAECEANLKQVEAALDRLRQGHHIAE